MNLQDQLEGDARRWIMKRNIVKTGFTLVELILAIAIIAIIAAASAPFYVKFVAQNNLEVSTDKVISAIRKTQSYAMDGKDNATWGFCMSGNNLRLFRGTCTTPTFNEDFDLTGVTVSGLTETIFSGLSGKRGEPSNTLNITVTNDIGSVNVVLNSAGGLDVN
ncbi:MAG: seg [Microgenomates group bacterium GW2011_GWC1_37_8]|uniref:Fimbrial protein, type IV pilin, PilE n=1 Tax=Candidatus Woesebacteria bacterium GW2011_GWB1_38_8 TaxID=1618570 RepID=A0A0G0LAP2_9BACT|nr:MAG: seg [Microgenomates group bacterium GW2011_GWC1_37_8]KKQ84935.1 MAG: Fimbrial protein, type IV pilin, PilE [Candidatus Woesebacteria bacterium GW2011_GWB1_38_8]